MCRPSCDFQLRSLAGKTPALPAKAEALALLASSLAGRSQAARPSRGGAVEHFHLQALLPLPVAVTPGLGTKPQVNGANRCPGCSGLWNGWSGVRAMFEA